MHQNSIKSNQFYAIASVLGGVDAKGNNGVAFSERDQNRLVTNCCYGQAYGWPITYGVCASIPTKGEYGTLNIAVSIDGIGVDIIKMGCGDDWATVYQRT